METKQSHSEEKQAARPYNRNLYILGLILGILIFVPCLFIAHKHQLTGLQRRFFYDLNNLSGGFTKPALWTTEALGAGYPIAVVVLVPLFYKRYRLAWRFLFTVGVAGVLMEIAKKIAKEPRPAALLHGHLHVRAVETGLDSFPSGHETMATAMALTLWLILPRKWRWVSIVWIVYVAFSRLYLGVHTFTDVLGGFAIGLAVACAVQLLPSKLAKRFYLDNDEPLLKKGL